MKIRSVSLLAAVVLSGCGAAREANVVAGDAPASVDSLAVKEPVESEGVAPEGTPTLDRLEQYLTGRFDSSAQAAVDEEYFAIQLLGCAVNSPGLGERVLYIEQAVMESSDRPYRQRLYVLEADEVAETARTTIYSILSEQDVVGFCDIPAGSRPDIPAGVVEERVGCGVALTWNPESGEFVGSTDGDSCSSTLRGATYATSEVTMDAERILSWDRGFDADGEHVWGAVSGAYEFMRQGE